LKKAHTIEKALKDYAGAHLSFLQGSVSCGHEYNLP
jgi:hypothetical protein